MSNIETVKRSLQLHIIGKLENCIECGYDKVSINKDETCAHRLFKDCLSVIDSLEFENNLLKRELERFNTKRTKRKSKNEIPT